MALTVQDKKNLAAAKAIVNEIDNAPFVSSADYFKTYQQTWERITAHDKSIGSGLKIGRVVKWPVADGYASYFVVGITKTQCTLAHIGLGDGYQSPVVYDGKAPRPQVELSIRRSDAHRELFGRGG